PGTVGVITPMSHNYCDRCNRMRLTADGQLRPCLFGEMQTNLRDPLRRGEPIAPLIRQTLRIKPERHWLAAGRDRGSGGLRALSQVGGWARRIPVTRIAGAEPLDCAEAGRKGDLTAQTGRWREGAAGGDVRDPEFAIHHSRRACCAELTSSVCPL